MGENNAETYNNVMRGAWDFDDEAFENISDAAKDFISRLLVRDKKFENAVLEHLILRSRKRMSARECLQHEWVLEHRARARCDAALNEPNTGPPIDRVRLRSYVQMRRWRVRIVPEGISHRRDVAESRLGDSSHWTHGMAMHNKSKKASRQKTDNR